MNSSWRGAQGRLAREGFPVLVSALKTEETKSMTDCGMKSFTFL